MVSGISAFKAMDTTSSESWELNKSQYFRTKLPPFYLSFEDMDDSTSKNVIKFLTYQEATNLTLVCKFVRNRVFPHIAKAKRGIVHWQDKPFQKWNHFTRDLLAHTCQFLSPEETAHASAVCKGWNSGIDHPIVWRRQCEIQGYQVSSIINPLKYKSILKEPIKNERSSYLKELFRKSCIDGKVKIPRPGDMRRINMQPNPFSETGETIGQSCFWFGLMSSNQFKAGNVTKLKDLPNFERMRFECEHYIGVEEVRNEVLEIFQSVLCEDHTVWYLIMKQGVKGSKDELIEKIKEAGYQRLTIKDVMVILLLNKDFWLHETVKLQNEGYCLLISGGGTTSLGQNPVCTYSIWAQTPRLITGFHYQSHPVKKISIS